MPKLEVYDCERLKTCFFSQKRHADVWEQNDNAGDARDTQLYLEWGTTKLDPIWPMPYSCITGVTRPLVFICLLIFWGRGNRCPYLVDKAAQ